MDPVTIAATYALADELGLNPNDLVSFGLDALGDWILGGCSGSNKTKYRNMAKVLPTEQLLAMVMGTAPWFGTGDCQQRFKGYVLEELLRRQPAGGVEVVVQPQGASARAVDVDWFRRTNSYNTVQAEMRAGWAQKAEDAFTATAPTARQDAAVQAQLREMYRMTPSVDLGRAPSRASSGLLGGGGGTAVALGAAALGLGVAIWAKGRKKKGRR